MALLSVDDALERILSAVEPTAVETIAIEAAYRRTLAQPLSALLTQPPFDASAMDGYAVRTDDIRRVPTTLALIGAAAAGHPFSGTVGAGQAVRIFTGAPVPAGADAIVIQEDADRDGATVHVRAADIDRSHIRTMGGDFKAGDLLLKAGRRLGAREMSLAAAMGHGTVPVRRRPHVAILCTGDELVPPGSKLGPGQIIVSNHLGVAALVEGAGAEPRYLGIARDTPESLKEHLAGAGDADVIVTIGGASVGDHDLVAPVLKGQGLDLAFWKIAIRPGKPLMFGRLGATRVLGLPGNPVSSLVCARVFLVPLIRALLGDQPEPERPSDALAAVAIDANGPRQHYMRAILQVGDDGLARVTPVRSQDSSLLSPLAEANCLIVRLPKAPPVAAGSPIPVLALDF